MFLTNRSCSVTISFSLKRDINKCGKMINLLGRPNKSSNSEKRQLLKCGTCSMKYKKPNNLLGRPYQTCLDCKRMILLQFDSTHMTQYKKVYQFVRPA